MKKLLVVLCVLLAMVSCAVAETRYEPGEYNKAVGDANDLKKYGDFQYVILKDKTAEIVAYTGNSAMLKIPSKLGNYKVTSIGYQAFYPGDGLTEVVIPDSVVYIAPRAFSGCQDLGYISVPGSVETVGEYAFYNCNAAAFIFIAPGVRHIGANAFSHCDALMTVTLPDTIISLGTDAFSFNPNLDDFTIPLSVEQIEGNPIAGCGRLSDIRVDPNHPNLMLLDGVLFDKNERRLICYPAVKDEKTYTVPNGIYSIGNSAFRGNKYITEIEITSGVTEIGTYAFAGCAGLTDINIPEGVSTIRERTFLSCTSLAKIVIPDQVTEIEYDAFVSCDALESVTLSERVTNIRRGVFSRCPNLTLTVTPGSYAEQYAIDNNIPYVCADEGGAAPADGSWSCTCGAINTTKFCPECGQKKPEDPQCSSCGYKPEGAAPKFCPECGTKF